MSGFGGKEMCINPSDIRWSIKSGEARLLVVGDQLRIIAGGFGVDPVTFIESAIADHWGKNEIADAIREMMISIDLRDQQYNIEVRKIIDNIPKMVESWKLAEEKRTRLLEESFKGAYNTGLT